MRSMAEPKRAEKRFDDGSFLGCTRCGDIKPYGDFDSDRSKASGRRSSCIACDHGRGQAPRPSRFDDGLSKECTRCGDIKPYGHFAPDKRAPTGRQAACYTCQHILYNTPAYKARRKRALGKTEREYRTREEMQANALAKRLQKQSRMDAAAARRRPVVAEPTAETIDSLVALQRNRAHCMTIQQTSNNYCEAFIVKCVGYKPGDVGGRAAYVEAKAIRLGIEKDIKSALKVGIPLEDIQTDSARRAYFDFVKCNFLARDHWDQLRKNTDARMRSVARTLPCCDFFSSIRGVTDLLLAIIVAEAGHLSRKPTDHYRGYQTKERLWKRLGFAVVGGERQGKRRDPTENAKMQFVPARFHQMKVVSRSLYNHQWMPDLDADGNRCRLSGKPVVTLARAVGPYGEVYERRRRHTVELNEGDAYRERALAIAERAAADGRVADPENLAGRLTTLHLHNDAVRVMTKALLEDLWRVWNGRAPLVGELPNSYSTQARAA
jgi:hypothetical protein